MAAGITEALNPGRFGCAEIVGFSRDRFDAGKNYAEFADKLIALHL